MAEKVFIELRVLRTEELTPSLRRVVLGGPNFDAFEPNAFSDSYVKVALADPASKPPIRTFSVSRHDSEARELAVDFVVHGDVGVAGPWAMQAQPGDALFVRTPGGAYAPDPDADAFLFVGDEAAIPSISNGLRALPVGAQGAAFIEVNGPEDELVLDSPFPVTWLHRGDAEPGSTNLLDDAVRAWEWPEGRVQAFVHGESTLLKTVRPYVRERVDRKDLSVSAYWRRGETEEGFRAWKATQDEAVIRPQG